MPTEKYVHAPEIRAHCSRIGTQFDLYKDALFHTEVTGLEWQTNSAQWFRGDVAPFFGVSYAATDKLTLKAEYSSDGYDYEVGEGLIERRTPWNLGLEYELFDGVQLGANYAYGDRIGVQLSFAANPDRSSFGPQVSASFRVTGSLLVLPPISTAGALDGFTSAKPNA